MGYKILPDALNKQQQIRENISLSSLPEITIPIPSFQLSAYRSILARNPTFTRSVKMDPINPSPFTTFQEEKLL